MATRSSSGMWSLFTLGVVLLSSVLWFSPISTPSLWNTKHKRDLTFPHNSTTSERGPFSLFSEPGSLVKRWDGSCSAAVPCPNSACCGASGYCGYGPDFCGKGCISNCDAHAECGKYALPANKTCPLNVCCSEFGFCGTTTDFCNDKCQSNCKEHPKPPSAKTGKALSRVIGYYEGWNARSECHQTKPEDLPLGALTHVNFAFASVEPDTYKIISMDSKTPESLFDKTTNLKILNPDLKVFISVGGWTFSDNGTLTQPLLGEIAADKSKRAKFVSNIITFINYHGFDGFDLDWEYPGAPDRGGKKEDTENMVLLFKDLRQSMDDSGRKLELSFTIPASFWYLRWFDVPKLLKYADWTNLMSYDIHGIWDRENNIGSIVQPHTNLTEIKLAAELLWRNDVSPEQVVIGYGFYGRSFTLADPSCSKPGCAFSDAAKPGVCTGTGGYLAHYELVDILKRDKITPVWDKDAAVKYFTFDSNQWVSYDDEETFKQKIDWANDIGFSGALIWASDLDDYMFSAHEGLIGKKIKTNKQIRDEVLIAAVKEVDAIAAMDASLDTACYRVDDCMQLDIFHCAAGYKQVGWDLEGCEEPAWEDYWDGFNGYARPICCKTAVAPEKCIWRGGGLDCNGQCHTGEVTLYQSSNGGGFSDEGTAESENPAACNRGSKAFCCTQSKFDQLVSGCYWTGCGEECKLGELDIAFAENLYDKCNVFKHGMHYCCKGVDEPLKNCHWVGQGDCADNTCNAKEVTLARDSNGDSMWTCHWNRKKDLCCTVNNEITEYKCTGHMCDFDGYYRCGWDDGADDLSIDETDEIGKDLPDSSLETRFEYVDLEERNKGKGKAKVFDITLTVNGIRAIWTIISRGWPGSTHLHDSQRNRNAVPASDSIFVPDRSLCSSTKILITKRKDWTKQEIENGLDTEHNPDAQYGRDLFKFFALGELPNGESSKQKTIPRAGLEDWNKDNMLPVNVPRAGASRTIRVPNAYFFDRFGSQGNRSPLLLADREMNQFKGRIFDNNVDPMAESSFNNYLEKVIASDYSGFANEEQGVQAIFNPIRMTISVFRYLHTPEVLSVVQNNRRNLLEATRVISANVVTLGDAHRLHEEFDSVWHSARTDRARDWVQDRLVQIIQAFSDYRESTGTPHPAERRVFHEVGRLQDQIKYIEPVPQDPEDEDDSSYPD